MKSTIIAVMAAVIAGSMAFAQQQRQKSGTPSEELHQTMTKGSEQMQSMEMSGNVDRDFVQSMLMHHRNGVEMAQIQVERGNDPKAKEVAKKIMDQQKKEIKQLEQWLSANGGEMQSGRKTGDMQQQQDLELQRQAQPQTR